MKLMVVVCGVVAGVFVGTVALAGTGDLPERPPERLGSPGTVALGGYAGFHRGSATSDGQQFGGFGVTVAPLLDVFVLDRVSLGVSFPVAYSESESRSEGVTATTRATSIGPSARLGYYIPLGERVALWPVLSAAMGHVSAKSTATHDGVREESAFSARSQSLGIEAQILVHVGDGCFLRAVPAGGLASWTSSTGGGMLGGPFGVGGSLLFGFGGWI